MIKIFKKSKLLTKHCNLEAFNSIFADCIRVLMEEEIAYRSPDFLTEAYSENFVNKYIGKKNLELYKKTDIYKGYREDLIKREKQNEAVHNVIHYQYFDTKAFDDIYKQIHLLSLQDRIAYFVFALSKKIAYVIVDSCIEYFSDVKIEHVECVLGEEFYKELFVDNEFNLEYKDYFMSRIKINDKYSIIKHNASFNSEETYNLMLIANVLTEKINEAERIFNEQLKTIMSSNNANCL